MIELDAWQKEIIADQSKYILLCKGRQIGGTSVFAEKAVQWMVEKRKKILVGSITEEQAKLVIVMVKDILLNRYKELIGRGRNKPTLDKIMLKNGGEIRSRPVGTMGDAFRGFTADVNWFNEGSKWPELAFISIMPTLMTRGGEMWMDSTPFGKSGFFYQCFLNKNNLWKIYYKTSEEVLNARPINTSWTEEIKKGALQFLEHQKKELTTAQYSQEYLGLFLDELRQVFPDDLIRKCMVLKRPNTIDKTKKHYLGVDIARMGEDESTFEIMERKGDRVRHVENQITKKTLTTETAERILGLDRLYNFKQIFIDDGGMGIGVFDQLLTAPQTSRKTVAINNADRPLTRDEKKRKRVIKEEMINNMLMMMEKGNCLLLDDPEIFTSLKSMQFEVDVNTKKTKYFGSYTHIADGLWRACWAVKDKSLNIWVRFG